MYNNTFLILYGDSASASLNISRNFAVMFFPTKSLCDYVSCQLQSKVCFTYLQNPSSVTKEHWSENNQLYSRGLIWRKQIYIVRV